MEESTNVEVIDSSIDYMMVLPKKLWKLKTGTVLSAGPGGGLKVAENGDWVVGYAVNEGLSHYMKLVVTYVKNEDVGWC